MPIAKTKKLQLLVSKCLGHCGCGWAISYNDALDVLHELVLHSNSTGHICHFQGEVRPVQDDAEII